MALINSQPLPGIAYATCPEADPHAELSALANVYRFVLDCHAKEEATRPGSPDDAKEIKNDSRQQQYTG
jgi:hypothetical protein